MRSTTPPTTYTYVFDGQDLFDDEPEEDYRPARPRGGKRLAEKPSSSPFANADINWPRMITFLCSLVIIVAALVIVFVGIYPKLRGGKDPVADNSGSPAPSITDPVGDTSVPPVQPVDPAATDPAATVTDPVAPVVTSPVDPATQPPLTGPGDDEPTSVTFKVSTDADFTLQPNESHTIALNIAPASWSGTITWVSSNTAYATVDANGKVTNVNTTDRLRTVVITATAGSVSIESTVRCRGTAGTSVSQPPVVQTDPPVVTTQTPPPSGGNVTVGRPGVIVGAEGGLRVRSGPGTSNAVLATLWNNNPINVVAEAGDGWYQITFPGEGGVPTTGYIRGEYISTN